MATAWEAIKALRVRGAPAIGIAAAYGAVLGGQEALARGGGAGAVRRAIREASAYLRTSRPTAVNLFWALDRVDRAIDSDDDDPAAPWSAPWPRRTRSRPRTAPCAARSAASAPSSWRRARAS